ncbi:hypothetical protein pdam_00012742 [Pocillopora damicornis]|uniref:Uncharacterized protein n=1 Tax=Pocillopora damicornis TaxID=46731 RepID=A0A3M6TTF3_POCDA|nr:hypothetical protein pdam_00012742 [Pocillopora damicornis]
MTRNLSALKAMTPKNEAEENKIPETINAAYVEQVGPPTEFNCNHLTNNKTPTPRSETAALKRSVFRVFDSEECLLSAWIVTLLNMTAVIDNKAFKTQFAMCHEFNDSSSILAG